MRQMVVAVIEIKVGQNTDGSLITSADRLYPYHSADDQLPEKTPDIKTLGNILIEIGKSWASGENTGKI